MRILLIYPPNNPYVLAPSNFEPLALEILAALVPDHQVIVFDMRYETFSSLLKILHSYQPEITGLTCNNTLHVNKSLEILDFVRSTFPASINILGGHHPTIVPDDFYRPSLDFIFLGWAEKSFPCFIKAKENHKSTEAIPGLITLNNGIPVHRLENPFDLKAHEIPFPARQSTRRYWNRYRNEIGFRTALVNTARGCPFRCSFCSVWKATKGHFLVRPAEAVFYELTELPSNARHVFFADDNTFIDTKNAETLCDLIRLSGIRQKYSGYCRTDTIIRYPYLMKKWKKIGLENLCVGFEGIDEEGLKKFNKLNREVNNSNAARILHGTGIPFRSYFLIDPEFQEQDFHRILAYVRQHYLINPIFTIITPLPGTDYYEEVRERISLGYDYFDFMHPIVLPKIGLKKFYGQVIKLFMKSYSFRRHFGLRMLMVWNCITGRPDRNHFLPVMPLTRLVLLRILSIALKRKINRFIREAA